MNEYKRYLGDSVYASFDGYHIILTTENGRPSDPSNQIALEPSVLNALKGYELYLKDIFKKDSTKAIDEEKNENTK